MKSGVAEIGTLARMSPLAMAEWIEMDTYGMSSIREIVSASDGGVD